MNFFGHAAVAASHFSAQRPALAPTELAQFCAGAMLPDFLGMLQLRVPSVRDESLARGVSFHHRTDHVFHELASFHQLSRGAFAWLSEHGMARGPARAVAHIGIEMLLDEVLAADASARDAYRAALAAPFERALAFDAADALQRLQSLRQALLDRALLTYATPSSELVAQRIRRALAGRPRLETDDAGELLLGRWVTTTRPLVNAAAPALFAELHAQLANLQRAE